MSSLSILRETEAPAQHVVESLKSFVKSFVPPTSTYFEALNPPSVIRDANLRLLSLGTRPRSWLHRYVGRHERLARSFQEVCFIRVPLLNILVDS